MKVPADRMIKFKFLRDIPSCFRTDKYFPNINLRKKYCRSCKLFEKNNDVSMKKKSYIDLNSSYITRK